MQRLGEILDASSHRFIHRILHRQVEPAFHFFVGFYAQLFHFVDGPQPDVVFFFAAFFVFFEADDVVSDFVEEDGEADGGFGVGGFDPVYSSSVGVIDAPGAAAHAGSPFTDAEIVFTPHVLNDGGELVHVQRRYRHR